MAWEFTPDPVCTISDATEDAEVAITYDPLASEPYALEIAAKDLVPAPVFGIRFEGTRPLTITTDRHRLDGASGTVSVTDRGFGNVLDGLEFGERAVAMLGARAMVFPLEGAAPAVRAFRACIAAPLA